MDWIKIQSEEDIQKLNNAYDYFEDEYNPIHCSHR